MDIVSLQQRLQTLSNTLKQTQALIKQLSNLSSGLPNADPAEEDVDESETRAELGEEIHETLKQQEDDFELIQQDAEDLSSGPNWARRRDSGRDSERERQRVDLASLTIRLGEDLRT